MFEFLLTLLKRLFEIFAELPEEDQEKVIEAIVDAFELLFRMFFRTAQEGL